MDMSPKRFQRLLGSVAVSVYALMGTGFGWTISPPVVEDINPDPDIVEVNLTALVTSHQLVPGAPTELWTYNGIFPGPTIEAKVGDTLIVHFTNNLPDATTIHWHGQELPATMDGSHISQIPVPPGGSFDYEFKLLRPALFWYHPHVRTNQQVEAGLYGALIVRDPDGESGLDLPEREEILILDDIKLFETGNQLYPHVVDLEPILTPDSRENAELRLNGREGNVMLVNGQVEPTIQVAQNVPMRLRVVNVANTRFMRISAPGQTVWRIGGDGGLLEHPLEVPFVTLVPHPTEPGEYVSNPDDSQGVILTPGERADLIVTPTANAGFTLGLEWHDLPRGDHSVFFVEEPPEAAAPSDEKKQTQPDPNHITPPPGFIIGLGVDENDGLAEPIRMMNFEIVQGQPTDDYEPPADLRTIDRITSAGAQVIPLRFGHTPPDNDGAATLFLMMKDGKPLPFPKMKPGDAPIIQVGSTVIWEVRNMTLGMHNFHTHGWHFQWLETEYVDLDNPENNRTVVAPFVEDKDTLRLPGRPGAPGRSYTVTRIVQHFDDTGREGQVEAFGKNPTETRSGGWLFHCHILEHSTGGMMGFFQVYENPPSMPQVVRRVLGKIPADPIYDINGDGETDIRDVVELLF